MGTLPNTIANRDYEVYCSLFKQKIQGLQQYINLEIILKDSSPISENKVTELEQIIPLIQSQRKDIEKNKQLLIIRSHEKVDNIF